MRATRLLFKIALLALSAFCLPQCGQGIVQACSDDFDCTEEPNLHCDLAVHRCIARPCTPDCSARECGPDPQNCGTSCGTCKLPDQDCNPTGRCESCSPDCGVRVCGSVPNGCGESCGNCKDMEVCNAVAGSCDACRPDCGDRVCGPVPNGCGESCGSCEDPESCNIASGQCEGCTPDCGARVCGPVPNGCGKSCGNCEDPKSCDIANGRCETTSGTVLFDGRFTSAWQSLHGPIGNWSYTCIVAADRITSIPNFDGKTDVGKFVIKPDDYCNTAVGGADRNLVGATNSSPPGNFNLHHGSVLWFGFSFKLDLSWTDNNTWSLLWQWGAPEEALNLNSNSSLAVTYWVGEAKTGKTIVPTPLSKDVWYDVVIQLILSTGADGYYEVWVRVPGGTYQKLFTFSGRTTGFERASSAYDMETSLGIYRGGSSTNTQIIYFSGFRIGTTFSSVSGGSTGSFSLPPT